MNHSKLILVLFAVSFGLVLTISYVHAQTFSSSSSNSTLSFSFSTQTTNSPPLTNSMVIPYHPRNATAYYAEKQQLDSQVLSSPSPHNLQFLQAYPKSMSLGPLSSVNVNSGFNGLDYNQCNCAPPDVQIAVGPNHVMELVNVKGEIWNKTTTHSFQNVTLTSFFGFLGNASLSDPKILFDNRTGTAGRWFASILDVTNNTIGITVSKTNDPAGSWYKFHDSGYTGSCADQPKIGLSNDKFVVSVNDFQEICSQAVTSLGAEYHVFNKTALVNGIKSVQSSGVRTSEFATTPVHSLSSTSPLYMVSDGGVSTTTQIKLFNLTGQVPNVNFNNIQTVTVRTISTPADAQQPITTTLLSTGDTRILDAVWQKGNLWFSLNDGRKPTGETTKRSCVRLTEINTNTTKALQDFDINATSTYYYYPALKMDSFGGLGVVFGTSNSTDPTGYPSLIVT
jgi:hypothetical protein